MAERNLAIRLSLKDADTVKRALEGLGKDGQKALQRIQGATAPVSKGMLGVHAAAASGKASMLAYAGSAGVVGTALAAMGPAGIAAGATIGVVAVGAYAAAKAISSSVTVAGEFQQQMAKVGSVTRTEGKALSELSDLAREMGSTTQFSATQAAEGIEFLGMAGFGTQQIVAALPSTLKLAAAAGIELGVSADIASNILSGMRMEVGELDHVVDSLAVTSTGSNTTVLELGEAFANVAPGAAAAGVAFNDTAAALGVLADNAIKGGRGGTALNAAIRTLLKPSKEAGELTEQLGLKFFDSAGNMEPLVNIIAQLEEKGTDARQVLTVFGEEGGRAINALVGSGSKRLAELRGEIVASGGAAETMANKQLNTWQGSMKLMDSVTESLQITLGNKFLPVLKSIVDEGIIPAIGAVDHFLQNFGEIRAHFGQTITGLLTLAGHFIESIATIWWKGMQIVWQPWIQYAKFIFDHIRYHVIAPIWNGIGEDVVGLLNKLIDQANRVASTFGYSFDKIDFTPITTKAPKTMAERWEIGVGEVTRLIGEIGEETETIANNLKSDGDRTVAAWKRTTTLIAGDANESGKKAATGLLQNAKLTVDANGEADLVNPLGEKGTKSGQTFKENFTTALSDGFKEIITDQDFEAAAKGIGDSVVDFSLAKATDTMAEKSVGLVEEYAKTGKESATGFTKSFAKSTTDFFSGTFADEYQGKDSAFMRALKVPQTKLNELGSSMGLDLGAGVQSGLTTFMVGKTLDALAGGGIPDELILTASIATTAAEMLPEGKVQSIAKGLGDGLRAGVLGAGIAELFGVSGEIGAGIGAGLNAAIVFASGDFVGGITSAVVSAYSFAKELFDGESKGEKRGDAIASVQQAIRAGDLGQFGESGKLKDTLSNAGSARHTIDAFTTAFGIDEHQAVDLISFFTSTDFVGNGGSQSGNSRFGNVLSLGSNAAANNLALQLVEGGGVRDVTGGALDNIDLGLDDLTGLGGLTPEEIQKAVDDLVKTETPLFSTNTQAYGQANGIARGGAQALAERINTGRVQHSFLKALAPDMGSILNVLAAGGFKHSTGTAAALWDEMAHSGALSPVAQGMMKSIYGIDVFAANGFSGVVNKPTVFMTGEAGPEQVNVTPIGRGGSAGGGVTVNVSIGTVSTPNVGSMRQWVRNELMGIVYTEMKSDSFRRKGIISQRGLING